MNEQWTQDIRQKLADLEQPAPQLDWDAIFQRVDEQRPARRGRTLAVWQRVAVAAAVVGVLAGGAVYWSRTASTDVIATAVGSHGRSVQTVHTEPSQRSEPLLLAQADGVPLQAEASELVETAQQPQALQQMEPQTEELQAAAMLEVEPAAECSLPQESAPVPAEKPLPRSGSSSQPQPSRPIAMAVGAGRQRSASGGLMGKVYVAGAQGGTSTASAMGLLASSGAGPMSDAVVGGNDVGDVQWNTASAMDRTVKHHQPVRLGVSLRYALSRRWSLEAGLSYSRHTSDISETTDDYARYTDQRLTFIGLPVAASYSLWSGRYVSVYASAGAEVELMVHGTSTMRTAYGGQPDPAEREETVRESRPYFSATAALGLEAKLGQTVSLYLEPGLSYHFSNGSPLETIYSDKPLGATLTLGVRFTLK